MTNSKGNVVKSPNPDPSHQSPFPEATNVKTSYYIKDYSV